MKYTIVFFDESEETEWSPSTLFETEEDAEEYINNNISEYNADGRFNGGVAQVFPCDEDGEILEDFILEICDLTNE